MTGDIFQEGGVLILATRLRRASERLLSEITSIYKGLDIPFEPSWFPFFFLLDDHRTLSVSDLTERLRVSQSAVSQLAGVLESRGLVVIDVDHEDRRRRSVRLSAAGEATMERIRPVWRALENRLENLLDDGPGTSAFLDSLSALEGAMESGDLAGGVINHLTMEGAML